MKDAIINEIKGINLYKILFAIIAVYAMKTFNKVEENATGIQKLEISTAIITTNLNNHIRASTDTEIIESENITLTTPFIPKKKKAPISKVQKPQAIIKEKIEVTTI